MNIQQAKDTIKNTITAYLLKDDMGEYKIPAIRQRPILLMGPPGIGKTAIMEQVARECGIGLVAYTITHHTRQSAIGLPYIVHKNFGGKDYAMTEYTMSEIVASVYDKIETTGIKEGILFIDEINCVSETLAPMMLQFLQGKSFGNHKIPSGWIIVAAGNPPQYNKSVRDFDIVTLDRVKKIDVTEDFDVWKSYGYSKNIHGAIMTYLEIKKENFYRIETTVDGKRFVTARGWEDLSDMIKACETLNTTVDEDLIVQYLQHPVIAKDFAGYYDLYKKQETTYDVAEIVAGRWDEAAAARLKEASFDEKVTMIGLLTSRLNEAFMTACRQEDYTQKLFETLKILKAELAENSNEDGFDVFSSLISRTGSKLLHDKDAGLIDSWQFYAAGRAVKKLEAFQKQCRLENLHSGEDVFSFVKNAFQAEVALRKSVMNETADTLHHVFAFLEAVFGESQEMVIFMTELNMDAYALRYIGINGSEDYYKYNKTLLFGENRKKILDEIDAMPAAWLI